MTTYNLNLNKNYCSHWGIWEAIREIIQNGLDQQTVNKDNTVSVDYHPKTQLLTISNKDSILERKTLLLGASSKSDDSNTIGQFGEGYKIALLVLTKLGINVVIKNYAANEKWIPELKSDRNYEGEEVLKVKVQKYIFKKLPDHNLSFEITGITPEHWELIKQNYLYKHSEFNSFTANNKDQLLLDDQYKGLVFINGLFVEKLKGDYEFGYNFTPRSLTLDRDRQSVRSWEFSSVTSRLIDEYLNFEDKKETEKAKKIERVKNAVNKKTSEFLVADYHLPRSQELSDALIEEIKDEYGELAYPVDNQKEADSINQLSVGVTPVFVPSNTKKMISNNSKYANINTFLKEKSIVVSKENRLTPKEEMELFLEQYSTKMFGEAIDEFKELLKKSHDWVVVHKESDDIESDVEPIENDSVKQEEAVGIDSEESDLFVERKPVYQEHDDDIPF